MPFNPSTNSRFRCVVDVGQHWQNILDRTEVDGKMVMLTVSQCSSMLGVYIADGLVDNVAVFFRGWFMDPCEAVVLYTELAPGNEYVEAWTEFRAEQEAAAYEPA